MPRPRPPPRPTGPFAPGTMGYLEDSGLPAYDVAEAKRLVAEYEAEGKEAKTTLSIANDPTLQTQAEALQQRLKTVGIDVSRPVVTTCGSGVTASMLALALAVLGQTNAAVYDGSWAEWGQENGLPVETGPAR